MYKVEVDLGFGSTAFEGNMITKFYMSLVNIDLILLQLSKEDAEQFNGKLTWYLPTPTQDNNDGLFCRYSDRV